MLVLVIFVAAGCLPQPPPALPRSFLEQFGGSATFTVQQPPAGATGQDIVAALRAENAGHPMFRGRAVPVFGVIDCHGDSDCMLGPGTAARPVWVLLYPDCTDATGDFGWAQVDAERGPDNGYAWISPCASNG